jgi:phage terminase large subunit
MFIMEGNLWIDREGYGHVDLDDLHALLESVPGSHEWQITADNARPETIGFLAAPHVDNQGNQHDPFNIVACEKGKGSVDDGIAFLKKFKKIIIHKTNCPGTARDYQNYRWKVDKVTGQVLPIPVDLANHAPDASRYALESWMKGGATIYDVM